MSAVTLLSLTINNRQLHVAPGTSILAAATEAGIAIPTLCFHKALEETGSCWMCIVEIKGKSRFVPACDTPVSDGMVIETDNETLHAMRRQSLERIIADHSGDCMGPCELTCPAGCDIPDFVAAIAHGDDAAALRIIQETIPLPGILGRICPAPCEDACRRHGVDQPVSICALKRFAADVDCDRQQRYVPSIAARTGKRVAVVGSGPAGLTAASFLLRDGHAVTIFEEAPRAGGMMRYGIPRFRLPEAVLESDLAALDSMGVAYRYNTRVGRDVELGNLHEHFDAVLLAIGAQQAVPLGVPGEELPGVISGIGFLDVVARGNKVELKQRVVVAGGGNTAIDAARTAVRMGAAVTVLYRRSQQEMPANPLEIAEAMKEGVRLMEWTAPVAVASCNDGALAISVIRMEPGEPDPSGRRKPVPVSGSDFQLVADTLITAIGQEIDPLLVKEAALDGNPSTRVQVDAATLQTTRQWLFAAGDCVTGPDTAIRAVGQGRLAAQSISQYLKGEAVEPSATCFNSSFGARDEAPQPFYQRKPPAARVPVPERSLQERSGSFDEVVTGYTEAEARAEASRCLQCRCKAITDCRLRQLATHFLPLDIQPRQEHPGFYKAENADISMEREKCVDCGICVRMLESADGKVDLFVMTSSCPTGALSLPV